MAAGCSAALPRTRLTAPGGGAAVTDARRAADRPVAYHGEGPVWCPRRRAALGGHARRRRPLAGRRTGPSGAARRDVAAAVRPRRGGGAVHRRRARLRPGGPRRDASPPSTRCGPTRRPDERGRLRPRRPLLVRLDGLRPAPGRGGAVPARPRRRRRAGARTASRSPTAWSGAPTARSPTTPTPPPTASTSSTTTGTPG